MMSLIMNNLSTIFVSGVVLLLAGLAVRSIHKDKKAGKSCGSCGGCTGCSGGSSCSSHTTVK